MRPFLTAVWSVRGIAELLGALLLAVAIWFVAPALAGIDAIWLLCLLAALPVLFWLALMVFVVRRGLRRDAALVAGATALDPALEKEKAVNAAAEAEEREVSQRLEQALSKLQAAGASKWGSLYERPWYVIIGPPGAGKTTAIRNSGLDFLIEGGKVSGVGGTRNCDWWISEQAVLIDTAGRYTTQDSDKDADRTSWERFLDLLRRERPRQPLNGIIVAFAADMLSTLDADGCLEHARKVRSRIREMEDKLEQRLPVYFLICKADTVLGFTEFFDGISREARGQVWGVTFSPETKTEERTGELKAGYVKLIERLQSQLVDRLQSEPGASKRALLAGFPVQFATLEEPLLNFAKAAFGGSSVDPAPYLRGLYFASGTQEGSPIDRLTGVLAREFGLQPDQPEAFKGQGRSYFLSRLLREVVFNEARLASRQPKAEQRKRLAVACTWAASAALLVGGLWLGWRTLDAEAARMQQATAASQALETAASGLPLARSTAIDDLARFLPYLNKAAAVAEVGKGSSWSLGLSQEEKLHEAGQLAYQRALERVMLPRLIARLESQLQAGMNDPDYTYLGVQVYLMLGRLGKLKPVLVRAWMEDDWRQRYPGASGAATRESLLGHLDALLVADFVQIPVDGALVEQARKVASRLSPAQRIYTGLQRTTSDTPAWRPAVALGAAGQRLFILVSKGDLAEASVPGFFTPAGLHRSVLPALPKAIANAAAEAWVFGKSDSDDAAKDPLRLEEEVLRLYAQGFIKAWDGLLDELNLRPLEGQQQAATALSILGSPKSPLRDLMADVSRQLDLSAPPVVASIAAQGASTAKGALGAAAVKAGTAVVSGVPGMPDAAARVAEVMGGQQRRADPLAAAIKTVEDHFRPLREAATPTSLDRVVGALNALYEQLSRQLSSAPGSASPPTAGVDPVRRLMDEAKQAPAPLSRWLQVAAQSTAGIRAGDARAAVAAAAGQQLAPFCKGVEARFPFRRDPAAPDMPMDDFVRLFGPGGAFDQFFNQSLKAFVDTSQRPWRPVPTEGGASPISAANLAQFQRAAAIRDAFFPGNQAGQAASLRFELVLLSLDAGARGATLESDGTRIAIAAGAAGSRPIALSWPARGVVSLAFDGEPASSALVSDGPWAALRLVARGRLTPGVVPDRFRWSVQQGARTAEFELRTSSIVNPFAARELADFRCPQLTP